MRNISIRPAREKDLGVITEIYNHAVIHTTATFDLQPKSLEEQMRWFSAHGERHPILIAEEGGIILGWASLSPWSDRCAYADTAEVSVYLKPEAQKAGRGTALLSALIVEARRAGHHSLMARVADGNPGSLKVHERQGFKTVGTLKQVGKKFGKLIDVHFMQKMLVETLPEVARSVIPEAKIVETEHGQAPQGPGWYVLNLSTTIWRSNEKFGSFSSLEGDVRFTQYGMNVHVIQPGQPSCHYHGEDDQEDFLVLRGECKVVIEGQERALKAWDFVHCPKWAKHVFVGIGSEPCAILMVGGRTGHGVLYPAIDLAKKHGACPEQETSSAKESYASCPPWVSAKSEWK